MAKLTEALEKVDCYTGNIAEFISELNDKVKVIDAEDGNPDKLVLQIEDFGGVAQVAWDAVKGTMQECEGKTIEVRLPQNLAGNIIGFALSLLGFKF